MSVQIMCDPTSGEYGALGLSTNGSTWSTYTGPGQPEGTYRLVMYADETDISEIHCDWAITGLTAGSSYTYYLGGASHGGGSVTFRWGWNYVPMIFKVTSLPSTIGGY